MVDRNRRRFLRRCCVVRSCGQSLLRLPCFPLLRRWVPVGVAPGLPMCGVKNFKPESHFLRKLRACSAGCQCRACLRGVQIDHPGHSYLRKTKDRLAPPVIRNRTSNVASVIGGDFLSTSCDSIILASAFIYRGLKDAEANE